MRDSKHRCSTDVFCVVILESLTVVRAQPPEDVSWGGLFEILLTGMLLRPVGSLALGAVRRSRASSTYLTQFASKPVRDSVETSRRPRGKGSLQAVVVHCNL
eukprot:763392-Hanusia_phi.AAC.7